jgi:hypothetical protein
MERDFQAAVSAAWMMEGRARRRVERAEKEIGNLMLAVVVEDGWEKRSLRDEGVKSC